MNERLLDRFKKLPEQLKNMSNKELNETIDSARYIADEHAQVVNRHETQADAMETERQKLEAELKNMGVKQLLPKGIQLRQQINKLKKQEDEKRDLADHYREQQLYERTRMSEAKILQNKKYSHQEKPEYSKQMQQAYHDYLKYDTTAGRMITAREKMENETDPVKKAELKEMYEARAEEHQEYVDSIVYKQDPKPLKAEVKPDIGLEKVTEPQPATEKTIDTEPQKIKPGDMVVTWNQEPKPSTEVEERKQILLDLRDKTNESKPGRPKQLSLTPHMPPPNIQAEKDMMGSKQEARQNLDKLNLKEIQVVGRGCFGDLRDVGYQCKAESDPVKKAELEEERDSLNKDWQGIKQGVFDAAEREYGQERTRDRETERNPERDPK